MTHHGSGGSDYFYKVVVDLNAVWLTALGLVVATVLGAVLGDRMEDSDLGHKLLSIFGTVVMVVVLVGVLMPVLQSQWPWVLVLLLLIFGGDVIGVKQCGRQLGNLLLVAVIALHHFPEGLAAGLSCKMGDGAWAVCGAVVLHSIPETMAIFPAVRQAACSRGVARLASAVSGLMTILGLFAGCYL